jgi:hypothetical protein
MKIFDKIRKAREARPELFSDYDLQTEAKAEWTIHNSEEILEELAIDVLGKAGWVQINCDQGYRFDRRGKVLHLENGTFFASTGFGVELTLLEALATLCKITEG